MPTSAEMKKRYSYDPAAIEQDMMCDPEGRGGMRPVAPASLGTPPAPDAPLRSMAVDTSVAQSDANLVKPKGGEI